MSEKEKEPTPEAIEAALQWLRRRGGKARASVPGEISRLGKRGGSARAKALSPERRSEIAKNAVAARIAKKAAKKAAENAETENGSAK